MRIWMLTYYYWPYQVGGAENQCRRLAAQLVDDGNSCVVLTSRFDAAIPSREYDDGVEVRRRANFETLLQYLHLKPKGWSREQAAALVVLPRQETGRRKRLAPLLAAMVNYCNVLFFSGSVLLSLYRNRHEIDILHVHTADWIAGLAAFAGRLSDVTVVCKGADTPVFPEIMRIPFASAVDRWRKRPYFIALTDAMKEDLTANGVSEDNISIIPNGIRVPSSCAEPGKSRSFLYVGNFSQTAAHKGFDVLIEAWAQVSRQLSGVCLVMLGGGDTTPWQRLSIELGCQSSIIFAGYQSDPASYYCSSCCLLLPSRKEGISNAVLEAQSYGLPVIASDIPGNRAVVVHEQTGLIVPRGDAALLAQAIIRLYDSADERCRFGLAARQRIEQHFSIQVVSARTSAFYNRLIN